MNVNPLHQKKQLRALKRYQEILPDLIAVSIWHNEKTYTLLDLVKTKVEIKNYIFKLFGNNPIGKVKPIYMLGITGYIFDIPETLTDKEPIEFDMGRDEAGNLCFYENGKWIIAESL